MTGITTQITSDTDAGLNITSVDANDWLDYTVNIAKSGNYRVEFRVASAVAGGKFEFRKATGLVLSSMAIANTGGAQKWVTMADTIALAAGKQTLRVHALTGAWNMNWMNLVSLYPTSVEQLTETENSFTIAPNPVASNFTVKYNLADLAPVEFMLYNGSGQLVNKRKIENAPSHSGELKWNIDSKLAAGEYYMIIQQGGKKLATCKLIKN